MTPGGSSPLLLKLLVLSLLSTIVQGQSNITGSTVQALNNTEFHSSTYGATTTAPSTITTVTTTPSTTTTTTSTTTTPTLPSTTKTPSIPMPPSSTSSTIPSSAVNMTPSTTTTTLSTLTTAAITTVPATTTTTTLSSTSPSTTTTRSTISITTPSTTTSTTTTRTTPTTTTNPTTSSTSPSTTTTTPRSTISSTTPSTTTTTTTTTRTIPTTTTTLTPSSSLSTTTTTPSTTTTTSTTLTNATITTDTTTTNLTPSSTSPSTTSTTPSITTTTPTTITNATTTTATTTTILTLSSTSPSTTTTRSTTFITTPSTTSSTTTTTRTTPTTTTNLTPSSTSQSTTTTTTRSTSSTATPSTITTTRTTPSTITTLTPSSTSPSTTTTTTPSTTTTSPSTIITATTTASATATTTTPTTTIMSSAISSNATKETAFTTNATAATSAAATASTSTATSVTATTTTRLAISTAATATTSTATPAIPSTATTTNTTTAARTTPTTVTTTPSTATTAITTTAARTTPTTVTTTPSTATTKITTTPTTARTTRGPSILENAEGKNIYKLRDPDGNILQVYNFTGCHWTVPGGDIKCAERSYIAAIRNIFYFLNPQNLSKCILCSVPTGEGCYDTCCSRDEVNECIFYEDPTKDLITPVKICSVTNVCPQQNYGWTSLDTGYRRCFPDIAAKSKIYSQTAELQYICVKGDWELLMTHEEPKSGSALFLNSFRDNHFNPHKIGFNLSCTLSAEDNKTIEITALDLRLCSDVEGDSNTKPCGQRMIITEPQNQLHVIGETSNDDQGYLGLKRVYLSKTNQVTIQVQSDGIESSFNVWLYVEPSGGKITGKCNAPILFTTTTTTTTTTAPSTATSKSTRRRVITSTVHVSSPKTTTGILSGTTTTADGHVGHSGGEAGGEHYVNPDASSQLDQVLIFIGTAWSAIQTLYNNQTLLKVSEVVMTGPTDQGCPCCCRCFGRTSSECYYEKISVTGVWATFLIIFLFLIWAYRKLRAKSKQFRLGQTQSHEVPQMRNTKANVYATPPFSNSAYEPGRERISRHSYNLPQDVTRPPPLPPQQTKSRIYEKTPAPSVPTRVRAPDRPRDNTASRQSERTSSSVQGARLVLVDLVMKEVKSDAEIERALKSTSPDVRSAIEAMDTKTLRQTYDDIQKMKRDRNSTYETVRN